jgi:hypothetical protein
VGYLIGNETAALNATYLITYILSLPREALKGDIFAISISLILLYFVIFFIQKISTLLFFIFKKIILLIIVSLAYYEFLRTFIDRIYIEGITNNTIFFGALGSVIGIFAFTIAVHVAFHSIKKTNKPVEGEIWSESIPPGMGSIQEAKQNIQNIEPSPEEQSKESLGIKDRIYQQFSLQGTLQGITSDKRIGAVIAYIIIAEFGVFSSKTISAPSIQTGLVFFIAFLIASLIFIRFTYQDYSRGLRHLAAALMAGGILSIILGAFWGNIPIEQLLSLQYFTTDALVALVTALALSLFMGSLH